jgi:hypothetical protein
VLNWSNLDILQDLADYFASNMIRYVPVFIHNPLVWHSSVSIVTACGLDDRGWISGTGIDS